jgi:hypothetical protein
VVASCVQTGEAIQDEEDLLATACACYIVLGQPDNLAAPADAEYAARQRG